MGQEHGHLHGGEHSRVSAARGHRASASRPHSGSYSFKFCEGSSFITVATNAAIPGGARGHRGQHAVPVPRAPLVAEILVPQREQRADRLVDRLAARGLALDRTAGDPRSEWRTWPGLA